MGPFVSSCLIQAGSGGHECVLTILSGPQPEGEIPDSQLKLSRISRPNVELLLHEPCAVFLVRSRRRVKRILGKRQTILRAGLCQSLVGAADQAISS